MFYDILKSIDLEAYYKKLYSSTDEEILSVLEKEKTDISDLPILLSTNAINHLDKMAEVSERITKQRFGNIIQLYTPLYLSNKCTNACVYCGFRNNNKIKRKTLTQEEVLKEADILLAKGFKNLLLVAGTTQDIHKDGYLKNVVKILSKKFASVSIEVEELDEEYYRELVECGLDGVTFYQETYDEKIYPKLHPVGKKSDYKNRLNTMDYIGKSGVRKLGIGALLGLVDFRKDASLLGLHCRYLINKYWRSYIAVSFPRICESESNFNPEFPINDSELAQVIFAFRIIFPEIDLNLSTREPVAIRDYLCSKGITYMSTGSSTEPGGYSDGEGTGAQFDVEDTRSVEEFCNTISGFGKDIVWKDWN